MKEQFKHRVTPLKNRGVTLLELLIAISLMGLIFALGMYPMLSQITLFREQRSDIALFDDANLAVNYIIKDAMEATNATITGGGTGIDFELDRGAGTVSYTSAGSQLTRGGSTITNKLDFASFSAVTTPNAQQHQLRCSISFQDPDDASITTRRDFDVMLRCKDTRL